jgi:glycosyltransferase involved in cell wall biosynthesis
LNGKFVVMHSGNVGHAQDLESLVRAALLLLDLEDLEIVIVGFGARHRLTVELAERLGATNVRFLPYQERSVLPSSLGSADVHAVGLAKGLAGLVVPSRVYGVLAAARPVIAHADDHGETAALVREAGCGFTVPPGDPEQLAGAIRSAYEARAALPALGAAGREWVVANGSRERAVARYNALLHRVAGLPYEQHDPGADERDTGDPGRAEALVQERDGGDGHGRVGEAGEDRVDGEHLEAAESDEERAEARRVAEAARVQAGIAQ